MVNTSEMVTTKSGRNLAFGSKDIQFCGNVGSTEKIVRL